MDLPTWNRSRTKKKRRGQGSGDDAFQKSVRRAGRRAVRRAPLVIGAIVITVGSIVGGAFWYNQRVEASAGATRTLTRVVAAQARGRVGPPPVGPDGQVFEPPFPMFDTVEARTRRVDEGLVALTEDSARSGADLGAELVRAARKMRAGDHEGAEAAYREFLAHAQESHPLHFLAREGLGLALEARGELEAALSEFRILAAEKGAFYRDTALWHQGRVLEALERGEEALEVYRQYNEEFPQSQPSFAHDEVRARLLELDPSLLEVADAGEPGEVGGDRIAAPEESPGGDP